MLSNLTALKKLNLMGTDVTDRALDTVSGMRRLAHSAATRMTSASLRGVATISADFP